ncbi:hypothetical protein U9M48_038970 [Paspalum notatum var. saurae]|uniref:Uncharacterized protein n=1 Tax=Paspalum notatum var. saurae TaxID=547442 RepID=A0AAQ3UIN3_PASNO
MDVVESASATAPPPHQAPPPPPPPRTAAPTASAMRPADFVFTAAFFGVLAFTWLSSAANAAVIVAKWGYGEGSIPEAVAKDSAVLSSLLLGLFLHTLVLLLVSMWWRQEIGGGPGGRGTGTAVPPPGTSLQDLVSGTLVVLIVVVFTILAVGVVIQVTSFVIGAGGERAGDVLIEAVFVLGSLVFCFVTYPVVIGLVLGKIRLSGICNC